MNLVISFLPILLFVTIYVGSGVYFSIIGEDNAFYQVSPISAIVPAIILGWIIHRGKTQEKMNDFLNGVRHRDIITMCIVFLLAGAFGTVTQTIGSVDSTVNLALSFIPSEYLLVGIFLTAAFISTSIGTSMGTIATVGPIAANLTTQGAFAPEIAMATVVGGAMFGDNLSVISDTTIASVMSQEANLKEKIKLNSVIAVIAAIITITVLLLGHEVNLDITNRAYSLFLVSPYVFLIILAVCGVNVFTVLISAIIYAGFIGYFNSAYDLLAMSQDIKNGFLGMYEILLLSLMVGGLSGLAGSSTKKLAEKLAEWISRNGSAKLAQLVMAKIVSVFDILLANNTVAIIFSGEIVRNIAIKYRIPRHYSATWIDNFSCVFQGLIPYGAQVLLASSIAGISPLMITPYVYYCFALAIVSLIFMLFKKR